MGKEQERERKTGASELNGEEQESGRTGVEYGKA